MFNIHQLCLFVCFLVLLEIGMSGQAASLTDLVFVREKILDGKLQLCVAHTGHGYVNMDRHIGQRTGKYSTYHEFPHIYKLGLQHACFQINHPNTQFKLTTTDGMGRVKVGPWAYVSVVNNKIKQWTTHNNQIYKDESFYNEQL